MFRKLLNVGKGHSNADKLQQQQHQKNLFQLNEIRSYGFSRHCCLGYSPSLSLLAVGSKTGLLRVLGQPTVEFNYQLEPAASIRQIEFIDCRDLSACNNEQLGKKQKDNKKKDDQQIQQSPGASAKLVALTENGQLHLFELKTVKTLNLTDNTTQTDALNSNNCCQDANNTSNSQDNLENDSPKAAEYTKLEHVGQLDYFIFKLDDDDRSKRVTTFEISANGQIIYVGTEGGNLYQVPIDKFGPITNEQSQQPGDQFTVKRETGIRPIIEDAVNVDDIQEPDSDKKLKGANDQELNLDDESHYDRDEETEQFETVKFESDIADQIGDDIKPKKQGAIESVKRHPTSVSKLLLSYHRGLNVIYNVEERQVESYFYHNQVLESSCFGPANNGDFFYTSHNDGSYIRWDARNGSQSKANDDMLGQLYGPYPCKPTPKIQACTGLANDQLEDLIIFSGGMPRTTYDDKNPVTIVRCDPTGKDKIKIVLDFTSKVLDFAVITRPRGQLGAGAKSVSGGGGGGGKKNKNKQLQQQQQQRNQSIAVALAILAEEEFVVIDLLNSESYLEFPLPYLNCVHPSAITCNQHYSNISNELYEQLLSFSRQQLNGKLSQNDWPITGGKVIDTPAAKSRDILLTGHEDGSVNIWDVSDLAMRHLLNVPTAKFFCTEDDDLVPIDDPNAEQNDEGLAENGEESSSWPPLKRVGRFDPYSDDTRLAVRRISMCPFNGTVLVAGTGGQVLVFELKSEPNELEALVADEVTIISDSRFTWKGRDKLRARSGLHKQSAGYQLTSYVQLSPPAAATATDLRSDWRLLAVGTSYGFVLYDYSNKQTVVNRCTLNVQDFAIVSGDAGAGAISRKKSFRKSLRESFRRLRRGRSQRQQQSANQSEPTSHGPSADQPLAKPAFSRGATTGARTLGSTPVSASSLADTAAQAAAAHRNLCSGERQVEFKNELSSIVKCITMTSAIISTSSAVSDFRPSLWVGTNSGTVLVYAIDLASEEQSAKSESASDQTSKESESASPSASQQPKTVARLIKEIQLKHKAPIIAIFTSPEAPQIPVSSVKGLQSTPVKDASALLSSSSTPTRVPDLSTESEANTSSETQQRVQTPTLQAEKSSPSGKTKQDNQQQARVLICTEEQFKVFNLPHMKPFCKFKLTAHEGLRAKKISITQFMKPVVSDQLGRLNGVAKSHMQASSSTTLNTSKSLQSFATQTSRPVSPVAPAGESSNNAADEEQQANGAHGKQKHHEESNNNSVSALNNNASNKQQDKELLNAKFGVKTNALSSSNADKSSSEQQESTSIESVFEPYMICMSNQGDCAIYSVPDLKRQAQIQVCKREDVNGIMSAMLTNNGEGYYLRSSSNFLRFSLSSQRVPRVLSVI